jgi:hypothetical protein
MMKIGMKKTYRVPVEHLQRGYQAVDANSYEEAVQFLLNKSKYLKTPTVSSPVEGTMRVYGEGKFGKNAEKIAEMHEKEGLNVMPQDVAVHSTMFSETMMKV